MSAITRAIAAVALAGATLAGTVPAAVAAPVQIAQGGSQQAAAQQVRAIVDGTNRARIAAGLKPLAWNPTLGAESARWAQHMANTNNRVHDYAGLRAGRFSAENISQGMGYAPSSSVDQWLRSQGHRRNIMNPAFTSIGVGVAQKPNGMWFVAQRFR